MADAATSSLDSEFGAVVMMQATLSVRTNFAMAHINAAVHAAREAHRVDVENQDAAHGPWFEQMLIHVPVSIVMAAAAIEAAVNEWAKDVIDAKDDHQLSESQITLIKALLDDREGSALVRFDKLCIYLGARRDKGAVWEAAQALVEFRNIFMHFKPSWDNDCAPGRRQRLIDALKKFRVPTYEPYATQFLLPYGFMTYGCAKWAVESAVQFQANYKALHNGFADRVTPFKQNWTLP